MCVKHSAQCPVNSDGQKEQLSCHYSSSLAFLYCFSFNFCSQTNNICLGTAYVAIRIQDFPGGSDSQASVYNAGDLGLSPGLGRCPGEGNGNPLQYYCLENPRDREALVSYSLWGRKESDTTERLHFSFTMQPKFGIGSNFVSMAVNPGDLGSADPRTPTQQLSQFRVLSPTYHRLGGLNNCFSASVLETAASNIKVLTDLVSGEVCFLVCRWPSSQQNLTWQRERKQVLWLLIRTLILFMRALPS